jgi:hypothetical protein
MNQREYQTHMYSEAGIREKCVLYEVSFKSVKILRKYMQNFVQALKLNQDKERR